MNLAPMIHLPDACACFHLGDAGIAFVIERRLLK
jgi:hypothetical protein